MTGRAVPTRVEDLDLAGYRVLPDRSVRLLEAGDKVARAGLVATVRSVEDKRAGRVVTFDNAPAMTVSSPMWDGAVLTIYRPRAGF